LVVTKEEEEEEAQESDKNKKRDEGQHVTAAVAQSVSRSATVCLHQTNTNLIQGSDFIYLLSLSLIKHQTLSDLHKNGLSVPLANDVMCCNFITHACPQKQKSKYQLSTVVSVQQQNFQMYKNTYYRPQMNSTIINQSIVQHSVKLT